MPDRDRPLVLVSNRGPVTFQEDGSIKRGTGGLVTALTGLASHRDAVWIASALSDGDAKVQREHGDEPFSIEAPHGGEFRVRFVESEAHAYDGFYNVIGIAVPQYFQFTYGALIVLLVLFLPNGLVSLLTSRGIRVP